MVLRRLRMRARLARWCAESTTTSVTVVVTNASDQPATPANPEARARTAAAIAGLRTPQVQKAVMN